MISGLNAYRALDELQEAITSTFEVIPKIKAIQVFWMWRCRWEGGVKQEGTYFE
jgi:hypothetical protein